MNHERIKLIRRKVPNVQGRMTMRTYKFTADPIAAASYFQSAPVKHFIADFEPQARLLRGAFFRDLEDRKILQICAKSASEVATARKNGIAGYHVTFELPSLTPVAIIAVAKAVLALFPTDLPSVMAYHTGAYENAGKARPHMHLYFIAYPAGSPSNRLIKSVRSLFFLNRIRRAVSEMCEIVGRSMDWDYGQSQTGN